MTNAANVSHSVYIRAQAGRSNEMGESLQRLHRYSRLARGCLHFAVQQSQSEPDLWWVSGFWTEPGAMDEWLRSPAMHVFDELIAQTLVSSVDVQTFTQTHSLACARRSA